MAFYTQKHIYLNADEKKRCVLSNGKPSTLFLQPDTLYEGDTFIYCFTIVDKNGQAVSFEEVGDWYFDITSTRNSALLEAFNHSFNSVEDWEDVDPAEGKVAVNLCLADSDITSFLANASSASATCELWHRALDARWTLCGQWAVSIVNTCYPDISDMSSESTASSDSSESSDGDYSSYSSDSSDSSASSDSSGSSDSSASSDSSISSASSDSSESSSTEEENILLRYTMEDSVSPVAVSPAISSSGDITANGFSFSYNANGNGGKCLNSNTHTDFSPTDYYSLSFTAGERINVASFRFDGWTDDPSIGAMRWQIDRYKNGVLYNLTTSTDFVNGNWIRWDVADVLTLEATDTVEYRLYIYGASAGYYNVRIDNVTIYGKADESSTSGGEIRGIGFDAIGSTFQVG